MTTLQQSKKKFSSNFSKQEYFNIEKELDSTSNHIDLLSSYVEHYILPEIEHCRNFLDIGAGPGHLFKRISKYFETGTLIDPNEDYQSFYNALETKHNVNAVIGNFQETDLFTTYSFILCSHVLYHVSQSNWPSFLDKMKNLLSHDGVAMVTMVAPNGQFHELCYSIKQNYSNSAEVIKCVHTKGYAFRSSRVKSIYKFNNKKKILSLMKLFVIDDCFTPEEYKLISPKQKKLIEQKIENFVDKNKKNDNRYEFTLEEDYITIFN